jgi:hypothetical protein
MSTGMRAAIMYYGRVCPVTIRLPSRFSILNRPIIFTICRDTQVRNQEGSGITAIPGMRTILQIFPVPSYQAQYGVHPA